MQNHQFGRIEFNEVFFYCYNGIPACVLAVSFFPGSRNEKEFSGDVANDFCSLSAKWPG